MFQRKHSEIIGLVLVLLFASRPVTAQSTKGEEGHFSQNAVYLEIFGPGYLYSVNYDHRISKNLGFRVGFTTWADMTGLPIAVNYLKGGPNSYLEIGLGLTPVDVTLSGRSFLGGGHGKNALWVTGTLGYRYQPQDEGFLFRIGFTPFWAYDAFVPFAGISLGYAF